MKQVKRPQREKAAEAERLKPLPGWEEFYEGRRTRRKLDGEDYWET